MSKSASSPEALLSRVEWTVLRRLDGLLQGDYRSIFKGQGTDLAEIREYQYGDDLRAMDWNVTARLDSPYVRRYDEDRDLTGWLLLDASPSMDFGSGPRQKRESLEELVAALAAILARRGNRVAALIYDGISDEFIPPASGRRQVLRIIESLRSRPALDASPVTDLGGALVRAYKLMQRRSQVFVISDFLSASGWERPLSAIARRHDALAMYLFDEMERELPDVGILFMRDAETGEQRLVDTSERSFRKRFAEISRKQQAELRAALARSGVDSLELSCTDDIVEAVMRLARARKARRLLGSGAGSALGRSV